MTKMKKNEEKPLAIASTIDGNTFTRFAIFENFKLKKRWIAPTLFALIMCGFAVVCFTLGKTKDQSELLGLVLLSVGLVLPTVWYFMFMQSVRRQVKQFGLSDRKVQYFVFLEDKNVRIVKGDETAEFGWDKLYKAYRVVGCIYLYATEQRAFLLPKCDESDAAWEVICGKMGDRAVDLR